MPALTTDILAWIKDGFRDGVPDGEAPALYAVLTDRIGTDRAADVLRRLHAAGLLGDAAAGALLPDRLLTALGCHRGLHELETPLEAECYLIYRRNHPKIRLIQAYVDQVLASFPGKHIRYNGPSK